MSSFDVVEQVDGGWRVTPTDHDVPTSHHRDRRSAIDAAWEQVARSGGGQLFIHDLDGHVKAETTARR